MARPLFQISVDARMIFDRLATSKVGDEISFKELSEIIGADVQHKNRTALVTAVRKALHERRMVFAAVRNVGVKRLSDVEIISTAESDLLLEAFAKA